MSAPVPPIQKILESLHSELLENRDGEVATYIPELGKADPEWFGICLVTADGQVYQVGECDQSFTIQSISKPFVYGIALEDRGKEAVLEKIWMEPSGEAFNAISLRPGTGKPENPMINAGAITATSLVNGGDTDSMIRRIVRVLGIHAGRPLSVDESVYRSESETGHRNRAIGYMLRNFEILEEDPKACLEAYFMQCSISVTCRDLGMMAATLANGGVNPCTGERAVSRDYVENILSVMGSCGMYDAAGEWVYNVGMPAKSGVSGGILAVLPGQLGIGVFSPRLDPCGNSVRGIETCREITRKFGLHIFQVPRLATEVIRRTGSLARTRSSRLRSAVEMEALRQAGDAIRILELQGDLNFGTAEFASREFMRADDRIREMVLDFSHVTGMNSSAAGVLAMAFGSWLETGLRVSVCRCERFPLLEETLSRVIPDQWRKVGFFDDMPDAIEEAENQLLEELELRQHSSEAVGIEDCQLLSGLNLEDLETLGSLLKPIAFEEGESVMKVGDDPDGMYFLMRGKASAWIRTEAGRERRVATFSPGMNFGEMGLINHSPRSAEVRADSRIETMMLPVEAFDRLEELGPRLQVAILSNLSAMLADRLREANEELAQIHS
ncbi:glutaminase [Haloferula helveola]|uniref:Glutaminase n=1 Tax=Haloferula helveola TaxID=490095 RepID=A0ABM7RFT5_9BACT|nr:glutaminase [Haloferula helveola]